LKDLGVGLGLEYFGLVLDIGIDNTGLDNNTGHGAVLATR